MIVLLILLTGQFMANVDTSVVNGAAPAIHDDLRTSASGLQLVVSGFVLTYATLLIVEARLGARFGGPTSLARRGGRSSWSMCRSGWRSRPPRHACFPSTGATGGNVWTCRAPPPSHWP